MNRTSTNYSIYVLLFAVTLLLVTNLALYVRMNELQRQVIDALSPFQRPTALPIGAAAPRITPTGVGVAQAPQYNLDKTWFC